MRLLIGIVAGVAIVLLWQAHWRPWAIALFARGD